MNDKATRFNQRMIHFHKSLSLLVSQSAKETLAPEHIAATLH